ncbi:hypothetical protein KAR91_86765 [Candidatus Pacearchaeota archaeon]|nr:hypothetical protein [Candidatus Pacearchaeota archaeon]
MTRDELKDKVIDLKYIFTLHELNTLKYDNNIYRCLNNAKEEGFKVFCEIGFKVELHKKFLQYVDAFGLAAISYIKANRAKRDGERNHIVLYDEHMAEYKRLEEKLEPLEKELIAALDLYIDKGWPTTEEPKDENE